MYVISLAKAHKEWFHAKIKVIFFLFILLNLMICCSESKVYNSKQSYQMILSDIQNWTLNGDWDVSSDGYLTSGDIGCGGWTNITTNVDGPCLVTFEWKKIGDAELKCYYDEKIDPKTCEKWDWTPGRIRIPNGQHTVTWDFNVKPCAGIVCSVAGLRNINMPEANSNELDCTIYAPLKVCINSINVASIRPQEGADYSWEIEGGDIISGSSTDTLTWKTLDHEEVVIKIAVTRYGFTRYNTTKVIVDPHCMLIYPNDGDTQSIIQNTANNSSNQIESFYLDDAFYEKKLELNCINNIIISAYNSERIRFSCINTSCIKLNNCYNVTVKGLILDSNHCSISIEDSQSCNIIENRINIADGAGIYLNHSINNHILNNIIQQSGIRDIKTNETGLHLLNSNDNFIHNNRINMLTGFFDYFIEESRYNNICISDCSTVYCNKNNLYILNNTGNELIITDQNGKNLSRSITLFYNTWSCV